MSRSFAIAFVAALTLTGTSRAADFVVRPHSDTKITFVSKTSLEKFEGKTREVQGRISVDPAGIGDSARVHFEVDLASLDSGNNTRDQQMRDNYLETAKFPRATFDGVTVHHGTSPIRLEARTRTPLEVEGTFTLHGVSRRVYMTVHVTYVPEDGASTAGALVTGALPGIEDNRPGAEIRFETTFSISLADYNIQRPELVVMRLADTEQVHISGTAVAVPSEVAR